MLIPAARVSAEFPGMFFQSAEQRGHILRYQHGHEYAMFNAPDRHHDPELSLPLGYFITRIMATGAWPAGPKIPQPMGDDLLEALGPQKLAASVVEAVAEEAGLPSTTPIILPGDRSVTVGEVKDRYADLYDRWAEEVGHGMALKALLAEFGYLSDLADHITKDGNARVVVFGHDHQAALDKDSWFGDDRIYANCGTWIGDDDPTFVRYRHDDPKVIKVELWRWDGAPNIVQQESLEID